jgi:hypothetical protein
MPESTQPTRSWFDTTTAKLTGAVVAVGATLITARDAISRAFFKTLNKIPGRDATPEQRAAHGAFTQLQNTRDFEINKVIVRFDDGEKLNVPKEINKISKQYDIDLRARRKELGFTGVFQEAKTLRHHQWLEVAFATGAVASVAVGAIMAIASGRSKRSPKDQDSQQLSR